MVYTDPNSPSYFRANTINIVMSGLDELLDEFTKTPAASSFELRRPAGTFDYRELSTLPRLGLATWAPSPPTSNTIYLVKTRDLSGSNVISRSNGMLRRQLRNYDSALVLLKTGTPDGVVDQDIVLANHIPLKIHGYYMNFGND